MPNDIAISDKLPGKLITLADMLVHSTIIEQMKLLQLFWTSGDPILTSDDPTLDALQVRMKQRYVSATIVGGSRPGLLPFTNVRGLILVLGYQESIQYSSFSTALFHKATSHSLHFVDPWFDGICHLGLSRSTFVRGHLE